MDYLKRKQIEFVVNKYFQNEHKKKYKFVLEELINNKINNIHNRNQYNIILKFRDTFLMHLLTGSFISFIATSYN